MKKLISLIVGVVMACSACFAQSAKKIDDTMKLGENFYCINDFSRQFFFVGKDKVLLVDTGFGTDYLIPKIREVSDLPIQVVLTHGHMDHTGGLKFFDEVSACEKDFSMLPAGIKKIALKDGDVIDIGTFVFEVIEIPGHTDGSIVLLEKNKKFLIAGDSVQEGPIFMFGDVKKFDSYIASMEKLNKFKKNIKTIYSAHNTLSYGPEYIKYCIEDAKLFKAGKIVPAESEVNGKVRKTYKGKHVSFFAD